MPTPQVSAVSSFAERMYDRWQRVKEILTEAPLGLHAQLEKLMQVIGCDCVLLASSLPATEVVISGSECWEWKVQRVAPRAFAWLVSSQSHLASEGFMELARTLTSVAKEAQQRAAPPLQTGRLYLFNSWGSISQKFRMRLDQYKSNESFKLEEKRPIRVRKGKRDFYVTHVGIVLLGSVSIGRWEMGESYLVFLDLEKGPETVVASKRWVGAVEVECVPFLAYLAEVNAHFERLSHINGLRFDERVQHMKHMTSIELDAYCCSARRLTPLLEEDVPPTIETLIQMKSTLDGHGITPNEAAKLKQDAEATLAGFSTSSYRVLEDSRRTIPGRRKKLMAAHVRLQVDWTRIWWELEMLHQKSRHHNENEPAYEKWSGELPVILKRMLNCLVDTPKRAWFYSGEPESGSLTLNGSCLTGFLVTQVLSLCRNRIDPDGMNWVNISDARALEALTFARRLVCAIRYALACIEPDEEVLRALLWLLSEIGHDRFGIDRRLDFERHLCLVAMEQPALYGLKSFYRDHLSHVLQVCMTGWMLLKAEYAILGSAPQKIMDVFRTSGTTDESVLGQWFMASLLHDVGYIIDIGTGWADLLESFEYPVLKDLSERAKKMIMEWGGAAKPEWEGWGYKEEDRPGEDHGIVSALHVHSALEKIPDHIPIDCGTALKAIAHHNHLHAAVPFETEPLSVLLVLCDELQEWDRPWLDLDRAALVLSTMVAFGSKQARDWHEPLKEVSMRIRIEEDSSTPPEAILAIDRPVLDFNIEYRNDIHLSHSIFNAWLGRTRNLQRIKLGANCPIDFLYRLNSPVAPPSVLTGRDASEPELTRLWRIVRDERVWSIHKWMDQASNGKSPPPVGASGDQGVTYRIVKTGIDSTEVVALDVRKLGEDHPISDDLKEFWKAAIRWRHAGESMDERV